RPAGRAPARIEEGFVCGHYLDERHPAFRISFENPPRPFGKRSIGWSTLASVAAAEASRRRAGMHRLPALRLLLLLACISVVERAAPAYGDAQIRHVQPALGALPGHLHQRRGLGARGRSE